MILAVDLGKKTTGLAISNGTIATPYHTVKHKNLGQAISSIIQIIELEQIDTVVIGYVEGAIKSFFENFAKKLRTKIPTIKVILWDETLTTRQAKDLQIKLQVPKTKRKIREHEIAASFLLQSYLDSQPNF